MTALFSDTHPKMEALQIQLWRQASPTKKMNMVAQLNAAARTLALTSLRNQYPQATKAEIRRKLADLLLGKNWHAKCMEKSTMQNEPTNHKLDLWISSTFLKS